MTIDPEFEQPGPGGRRHRGQGWITAGAVVAAALVFGRLLQWPQTQPEEVPLEPIPTTMVAAAPSRWITRIASPPTT